jgi:tRNA(Arg) A34 adenosine deaminase TadA
MAPSYEHDADHLRRAIGLAREARELGDAPFGAVLIGDDGTVLAEARNTAGTERDVTAHAEMNLIRAADTRTLASSTLYASSEPCAMCSGAIFWAGVRKVVYGLGAARIYQMFPPDDKRPAIHLPCRDVLGAGAREIEVVGPMLEAEGLQVFEGMA